MVLIAQLYKFPKNHSVVQFQWVDFMVCNLYLSKCVKEKKEDIPSFTRGQKHAN